MSEINVELEKKIYNDHLSLWGKDRAIGKFHEESGELMQALNKHKKNPNDENRLKVVDEISHAQIALNKLQYIFGFHQIEILKKERLLKMESKIAIEKAKRAENMRKIMASMEPNRQKLWRLISEAGNSPLESEVDEIIAAVKIYCRPKE